MKLQLNVTFSLDPGRHSNSQTVWSADLIQHGPGTDCTESYNAFQMEIRFSTLTPVGGLSIINVNEKYENSLRGQSIMRREGEEGDNGSDVNSV